MTLNSAKLDTDEDLMIGPRTSLVEAQDRLVRSWRSLAAIALDDPKVVAALAAAEAIPHGIVLTTEDQAAGVVDSVRSIIDGERALAGELGNLLRIPKAMEQVARQATEQAREALAAAKKRGNDARVAYQQEVRRQAAVAEAAAREAARKATEAAAQAALEMGEDVPPEPELGPIAVPRTVVAGTAKSGTMVRIKAVEVVDWDQVPIGWLTLVPAAAKAAFDADVLARKVQKPAPGDSVVYCGVRFEAVESAVNR